MVILDVDWPDWVGCVGWLGWAGPAKLGFQGSADWVGISGGQKLTKLVKDCPSTSLGALVRRAAITDYISKNSFSADVEAESGLPQRGPVDCRIPGILLRTVCKQRHVLLMTVDKSSTHTFAT